MKHSLILLQAALAGALYRTAADGETGSDIGGANPFAGLGASASAQAQPAVEAAPKKVRAPAAVLSASVNGGATLKALKYPMPLKAARFQLTVNGESCEAAQTTFGLIKYTYFIFHGASFYIPGHHDAGSTVIFTHPEGYKFEPLKLDRKAQSDAAAKSKAAKAPATTPGEVPTSAASGAASGDAAPAPTEEPSGNGSAADVTAADTQENAKTSRKAKR